MFYYIVSQINTIKKNYGDVHSLYFDQSKIEYNLYTNLFIINVRNTHKMFLF